MTTNKKRWTWEEIWTDISEEMEIADEDFVTKDRCRKWFNDGIDDAEAKINRTNQEYFLTYVPPAAFEAGIDAYDLPENIYGSKIRDVVVNNGQRAYSATRLDDLKKFIEYRNSRITPATTDEDLAYFLVNESETGPRIIWSPVPSETTWSYEYWYYRNANRLEDDEDICDIPEFATYCFQWCRERIEWKRRPGSPAHMAAIAKLKELEDTMITTLQDMVVDGTQEIDQDIHHYEEHN